MSSKRLFISLLTLIVLIATSTGLILLAHGYRIDIGQHQVKATGILVVNSTPDGALIYLDDLAKDATNTSITALTPGTYQLRLEKQGYGPYQREVEIKKELVTKIEAVLVPLFPELRPLTITSATNPTLSPDGSLIVFTAPQTQNGTALWLLPLSNRPFNLTHQPSLLLADTKELKYSQMELGWSPDSQQILLTPSEPITPTETIEQEKEANASTTASQIASFVVEVATRKVETLTNTDELDQLKRKWQKQEELMAQGLVKDLPEALTTRIKNLPTKPVFSPDQTKLFYQDEVKDKAVFKVIDTKPKDLLPVSHSQTSLVSPISLTTPTPSTQEHTVFTAPKDQFTHLVWYPDSQHLLVLEKEAADSTSGVISLVELDGANPTKIFSGQIQQNFVAPDATGAKIVILTNFNPQSDQSNLYSINLR